MRQEWLGVEALCERIDKDRRTIMGWIELGLPHRKRGNRLEFPWLKCFAWWEQHIREDERATRHAGGDEEKKATLADAKVRTALAEAEQAEIALAKARAETVSVVFMRDEFQRIGSRIRTKLVQLPTAWAARLGACASYTDRRLVLLEAINALMPELQQLASDDAVAQIAERELPTSEVA